MTTVSAEAGRPRRPERDALAARSGLGRVHDDLSGSRARRTRGTGSASRSRPARRGLECRRSDLPQAQPLHAIGTFTAQAFQAMLQWFFSVFENATGSANPQELCVQVRI